MFSQRPFLQIPGLTEHSFRSDRHKHIDGVNIWSYDIQTEQFEAYDQTIFFTFTNVYEEILLLIRVNPDIFGLTTHILCIEGFD